MRVIDADGLRRRIVAFCTGCSTTYLTVENIVMMINQADTVDAVPAVRCRDCVYAQSAKINKRAFSFAQRPAWRLRTTTFAATAKKEVNRQYNIDQNWKEVLHELQNSLQG